VRRIFRPLPVTLRVRVTSWLSSSAEQEVVISTVAELLLSVFVRAGLVVAVVSQYTVIDGTLVPPSACNTTALNTSGS
jgi:hypothetical protein